MSTGQNITGYFFDWRREAERDGWHLADGTWRHQETHEEHADDFYVYLGSEYWVEAWPVGEGSGAREPDRPAHRERETAG
ncbi:hypothetical protein [Actinomadura rugatobispora]|uniref:Uncharacterized protein n=1 Tax=Actinomadura rugatobispora TaxID=1994 RepID=A0ABW0ZWY2_9ACTN|nr:hypothetical protein GCM10010200_002030 [Actinomadura rugatobispora]